MSQNLVAKVRETKYTIENLVVKSEIKLCFGLQELLVELRGGIRNLSKMRCGNKNIR